MNLINASKPSGNRCGHDPRNPILSPQQPIRKGHGCLPRILSLAAERAKEWFWNPQKCQLLEGDDGRQTRSERREAIQVVLEYLFSRLDLVTLCVGTPTMNNGFVDLSMNSIVEGTGLGQRRCERAIGDLKEAGFMKVAQPRYRNEEGKYVGLRAIRCLTARLFEWLDLGPMLARERARASQALKKRIAKYGRSLNDMVKRTIGKVLNRASAGKKPMSQDRRPASPAITRPWYDYYREKIRSGLETEDAQRLTIEKVRLSFEVEPRLRQPGGVCLMTRKGCISGPAATAFLPLSSSVVQVCLKNSPSGVRNFFQRNKCRVVQRPSVAPYFKSKT